MTPPAPQPPAPGPPTAQPPAPQPPTPQLPAPGPPAAQPPTPQPPAPGPPAAQPPAPQPPTPQPPVPGPPAAQLLAPQPLTPQPPAPGPPAAQPPALAGGYGWVVLASSFLALLLGYGSPQSVGVLYPEWLLTFREGKAMTAWVGSLVVGIGLILGPVCGVCLVNFGVRPVTIFSVVMVAGGLMLSAFAPNVPFLIFSYSVVVGVGLGLLYAATVTVTCLYFDKKRGLALGIMTTGASVGGVLYAELQKVLIDLFGLDGCLLVVGALALNVVACAGFMRPLTPPGYYLKQRAAVLQQLQEEEEDEASNQKPSSTDPVITMETRDPLARRRRRRRRSCSAFVKMMKIKMRRYSQCLSSMLSLLQDRVLAALCVCLFLFSLGSSYLDLQVLSVVLGFMTGNWALTPYVTSQVVGVEKLAEAHGMLMFFGGVGTMLGPLVVGCFYDFSQSYDVAFYLSGGCMMTGSLVLFLAAILPRPDTPPPPPEAELISCTVTTATDAGSRS